MSESEPEVSRGMLNGWKEIAAFLGKSVRSVQRWERDLGLPVRRINTPDHGQIVYASRSEIEQWRTRMQRRDVSLDESEPQKSSADDPPPVADEPIALRPVAVTPAAPSRTRWLPVVVAVALTLALGVVVGRWTTRLDSELDHVELSGTALVAKGSDGSDVWRHEFGAPVRWPDGAAGATFVDLDRDGRLEIIVPVRHGRAGKLSDRSDEVVCLRQDGTVMWRASPTHQVTQGDRAVEGPWLFRALVSPGGSSSGRSWIAFGRKLTSPAIVLEIDPNGSDRVRFVQDGAVTRLAFWPTPQGEILAVGGVHESDARAAIALLPLTAVPARAPTAPNRVVRCPGCPVDSPTRYFELPPSEVAVASGRLFSQVSDIEFTEDGLRVSTDDHQVGLISPTLDFQTLDYTDDHWTAHELLEEHRKIDHRADRCRERSGPREVRSWQEGTGWTTELVPSGLPRGGTCP